MKEGLLQALVRTVLIAPRVRIHRHPVHSNSQPGYTLDG